MSNNLYLSVNVRWTFLRLFRLLISLPKLWRNYERMMSVLGSARKLPPPPESHKEDEWIVSQYSRQLVLQEASELHLYIFKR